MTQRSVLIVEDEGVIARDIQHELEQLGYHTAGIVVTGEDAVETAARCQPHLVLMDIHLAGVMDGIEAATEIRHRLAIPSVFLTAYATDEIIERAKCAKPLGYIIKPFDPQSFRSTLEIGLYKDEIDRKLRASERRYRTLIETAHDAIVTTAADGTIVGWSRAAAELLGYTEREALGQHIDIVVPTGSREWRARFYEALLQGAPLRDISRPVERLVIHKDGSEIITELSWACWREDDTAFVACFMRDITSRRALEQKYLQAQKMEVMGRLAGGIAHDFNNILTVINGTCDFVLRTMPTDATHHSDFVDIREAGGRAERLTRQLLTFSRKQTSEPTVTSVGALSRQARGLLKRLLGEHIELVIQSPAPGVTDTANIDASQFEQVLLNLAVNARDAMPAGGSLFITTDIVELSAESATPLQLPPGRYVRLTVKDTGLGMTEDTRSRLFEPFFTTKAEGKGTGLGLATVYGIVTHHHGAIAVESSLGHGATFVIWLPEATETDTVADPMAAQLQRGSETILIVEDDVTTRMVAERILQGAGYHVLLARDGLEALDVLGRATPPVDLILTDVVMPHMDGTALADRLAATGASPAVLFMSAYTDEHIEDDRFTRTNFVTKPFTPGALTGQIRRALEQ